MIPKAKVEVKRVNITRRSRPGKKIEARQEGLRRRGKARREGVAERARSKSEARESAMPAQQPSALSPRVRMCLLAWP